ncbi:hypothetical protein BC332_01094 [Capsicum chinense]|nr:hypothetical protein BC332_01094 [Capsicum chinense]
MSSRLRPSLPASSLQQGLLRLYFCLKHMAERHPVDQQQTSEPQVQSPASRDDMIACVMALEAALLPCTRAPGDRPFSTSLSSE